MGYYVQLLCPVTMLVFNWKDEHSMLSAKSQQQKAVGCVYIKQETALEQKGILGCLDQGAS